MRARRRTSGFGRQVVAVTHEFSRTGAPIALYRQLRWLVSNTDVEVTTIGLSGGPLVGAFRRLGDVRTLHGRRSTGATQLIGIGLHRLGWHGLARNFRRVAYGARTRGLSDSDVVVFNSLESLTLVDAFPDARRVGYVHEFTLALEAWQEREGRMLRDLPIDEWWTVSAEGRSVLTSTGGIDVARIRIVPGSIIGADAKVPGDSPAAASLRRRLGVGADARLVVGSGVVHRRKGLDLFVQLAAELERTSHQPVACVWIGAAPDRTELRWVESDLRRSGASNVQLLGELDDPMAAFAQADVFVCTSREDPLPLVVLEVGSLGVPVVSYNTGSISQLLQEAGPDAARGVATHLDLGGLTKAVLALLANPETAAAAGDQLRAQVRRFHDIDVVGPATWSSLVGGQ